MSQILKYSVCFVVSLFLLSCNNEELGVDNNASLNQVKENLQLNKFSNVNISENVQVNWESGKETQKGNFKISEILASEKIVSTLEAKFLENHLKYQIVTIESEGQLYSYFVEVFTNKGSDIYPETITKLNGFTGTFNVFLLNGENLGSVAVYNGRAKNISENNTLSVLTACINAFMAKSTATNKIPQCGGNYTMIIDQTTSRFDVWSVGNEIILIKFVGTTTTRTTTVLPFPCDGEYDKEDILNQRLESYNYKNGPGNGPGTVATIITDPSFSNNPCLSGVFQKLGGSLIFQNYLKKFDSKFSVANLKLSASSTLPSNLNAETSPPQNYLVEIAFNSNNLNRPGLDIARTFLHEMIHAEMFRKLLSLSSSNGQIDLSLLNQMLNQHNYPGLYDYYTRYGINGMQHEQMAAHYRETMINFLKQYDSSLTQEQYESIAWEGLKGTESWNSKSNQEKQNISNIYSSWKYSSGNNCN